MKKCENLGTIMISLYYFIHIMEELEKPDYYPLFWNIQNADFTHK